MFRKKSRFDSGEKGLVHGLSENGFKTIMFMNRKYSAFLWLILAVGACKKTNSPSVPAGVDVYITGFGSLDTIPPASMARYWKNNKQFNLPFSIVGYLGQQVEYANGIALVGNDLYICGFGLSQRNFLSGSNYIAKYWKNGVAVNLTDGTTIAYATAIGIAGTDVYVTGTESTTDLRKTFGKYWKNGAAVILTDIYPTSIAVSGSDVYIAGGTRDTLTGKSVAVYLKNEIQVRLSDGSSDADANAILIDGSDIYVAGVEANRAVYWKNQVPVYLTDGSTSATLASIAVDAGNVVVAGNIGTTGTYWKNGIPVTVGEKIYLSGIATAGADIFAVGNISRDTLPPEPGYWINNERQMIFDSKSNSGTSQILVIKR
jgi:hypothetical protein